MKDLLLGSGSDNTSFEIDSESNDEETEILTASIIYGKRTTCRL